jgi:hypothetical protein
MKVKMEVKRSVRCLFETEFEWIGTAEELFEIERILNSGSDLRFHFTVVDEG